MQHKETAEYKLQKAEFLDNLQPDDFRNGGSFNQAEDIINQLNKGALQQKDPQEFIRKAVSHLFREGSPNVAKAIDLANLYIKATKL